MVGNPNYALELSNDFVRLLHRAIGDVWVPISECAVDDPEFDAAVLDMRKQARVIAGLMPRVVVILPISEVLFSSVDTGEFVGDAAVKRAKVLAADTTKLDASEIAVHVAQPTTDTQTPVAIVTNQTLQEAATYATSLGFKPALYATRWRRKNFPEEPVFAFSPSKSYALPIAAAASCAAAIGLLSFTLGSSDNIATPVNQSQVADLSIEPATFILANAPASGDITLFPVVEPASPDEGSLEEDLTEPAIIKVSAPEPEMTKPAPVTTVASKAKPLPRPAPRQIPPAAKPSTAELVKGIEKVTNPADQGFLSNIQRVATLEPTLSGVLSPDGFTLFKGKPPVSPPSRASSTTGSPSEVPQKIVMRPKPRPFGRTTPQTVVIEPAEKVEDQAVLPEPDQTETSSETTVVAIPDIEELQPAEPIKLLRPKARPIALTPETAAEVANLVTDPAPAAASDPVAPPEAAAQPPLAAQAPVPETVPEVVIDLPEEPQIDLLAMASPELLGKRPKHRNGTAPVTTEPAPETVEPAPGTVDPETPDLLVMASPELRGKTPRSRPNNLSTVVPKAPSSLDLASPALRGKKPKRRPKFQTAVATPKPVEAPKPEPAPAPEITDAQRALNAQIAAEAERRRGLATASRLAVAKSPFPPKKSRNFATTVKRTRAEEARLASAPATQKAPKSTTNKRPSSTSSTFTKNKLSLVGVFGSASKRRALFRTAGGRFIKVSAGGRVEGWRVSAVGESSVKITRGNRTRTLRITK